MKNESTKMFVPAAQNLAESLQLDRLFRAYSFVASVLPSYEFLCTRIGLDPFRSVPDVAILIVPTHTPSCQRDKEALRVDRLRCLEDNKRLMGDKAARKKVRPPNALARR